MLTAATRLGPYEILEPLGAGGMGEVYRARDPRLSRDVAVKLITTDGTPSPDRLRRFETEARAAAQLSHPNVVTVHDVGTHDGQPYLVLELLEGETLREALRGGLPPLRQAVSWALEVSRGLAAAHERGIVHRDLKPDNIFLTTDGRLKILDFGLAKLHEPLVSEEADRESPTATKGTSPGVLLGTVGYMSPEQVRGETPDSRTDVFALGVVFFEMLTGRRAFGGSTAPDVLAAILRDEPPTLESLQRGVPASLESVVRRCLAKRPADRFSSGRAVEAALETVLASLEPSRVSAARPLESRGPYPGLSSFTEADAERFFGREAEVEALWQKLRRGRLLAVIGPSGAGKTSFVRAGLVPSRLSGWGVIVTTPGSAPLRGLAEALVGEMPSDPDSMRELLRFDDPDVAFRAVRKWRSSHLEALIVVDQFEELFTLNPPEAQERFAELLGRLANDADVRVLVSMRDDFLIRCHQQKPLEPVFLNLTPLLALEGDDLRHALTEPAKREGFSFEDDSLVDEMLESVADARGALPLLAFAVARLWEKRDLEKKVLTRRAYDEIGGVAGALALHAEQTLERIGLQREPVVRELFRNLVTAQWTRAVADREELLSVLPDREVGAQMLDQLIDARLLTSSSHPERGSESDHARNLADVPSGDASAQTTSRQQIEIVHESLLRAWPRLVRWQAQDEEGAVLRDQLKQASHLWVEKDRSPDLLWSGTAYREFELWRDRYPGQLTAVEEDFSRAMSERSGRRRTRRRVAVAAGFAVLLGVVAVVEHSRQQTAAARDEALAEAQRAEASKVLALGKLEIDERPTAAVAYAMKSLELADTNEARLLALEALQRGPTSFTAGLGELTGQAYPNSLAFSPDGRWIAAGDEDGQILLWSEDGGTPLLLGTAEVEGIGWVSLAFGPRSERLVSVAGAVKIWSVSEKKLLRELEPRLGGWTVSFVRGERFITATREGAGLTWRSWSLEGGEPRVIGRGPVSFSDVDARGSWAAQAEGRAVRLRSLEDWDGPSRLVGSHETDVRKVRFDPAGDRLAVVDTSGEIRLWSLAEEAGPPGRNGPAPLRVLRGGGGVLDDLQIAPDGTWLAARYLRRAELWDLEAPAGADAHPITIPLPERGSGMLFHPGGRWLVVSASEALMLHPLAHRYSKTLRVETTALSIAPGPDGRWLVSGELGGRARVWSLQPGGQSRVVVSDAMHAPHSIEVAPDGRHLLLGSQTGALLVPVDGASPRRLEGFSMPIMSVALGPEGRLAAAASTGGPVGEKRVRVWDVHSGESRWLGPLPGAGDGFAGGVTDLEFGREGTLFSIGKGEGRIMLVARWDLDTGEAEILHRVGGSPGVVAEDIGPSPDGRRLFLTDYEQDTPGGAPGASDLVVLDLETGEARRLGAHDRRVICLALGAGGELVATGDRDGILRVGPAGGDTPHVFFGHEAPIWEVAVDPRGRWVASSADDGTIRVWPMPEGPPFYALPRDELLAKLGTLTNLRAVPDEQTAIGYRIEAGPFPGWKDVPTW